MCRVSDDFVELLQEKNPRARKEHRCEECGRTIGVGETYRYEVWIFEGEMGTGKTCHQCCQVRRWLSKACDGWIYTELEDDLLDHVTGEEKELRTRPLTRLARWMGADWRDRAGNLRTVEAVKAVTDEAIAAYQRQYHAAITGIAS